jgi:trans-2-enoyl-CoA reductase
MTEAAKEPAAAVIHVASDAEIDQVIAEFGGDAREAIRALLHDLSSLAADQHRTTSYGYLRGNILWLKLP